jgi:putative transcriptional regulator
LLDTVLERLDSDIAPEPQREADRAVGGVPRPLRKLIPGGMAALRWSRVTPSLQSVILRAGDVRHQVSLIRMRAGGRIPEHGHGGSELTVVLQGGFSDHTGSYRVGDFVALGAEHVHRPIAHQNEDCICLAAQDAPLQFTGFWSRLLNPFLSIEPA